MISSNSNLTIELIEKYPDLPWNWFSISCNKHVTTINLLETYPNDYHKPWDLNGLSQLKHNNEFY